MQEIGHRGREQLHRHAIHTFAVVIVHVAVLVLEDKVANPHHIGTAGGETKVHGQVHIRICTIVFSRQIPSLARRIGGRHARLQMHDVRADASVRRRRRINAVLAHVIIRVQRHAHIRHGQQAIQRLARRKVDGRNVNQIISGVQVIEQVVTG